MATIIVEHSIPCRKLYTDSRRTALNELLEKNTDLKGYPTIAAALELWETNQLGQAIYKRNSQNRSWPSLRRLNKECCAKQVYPHGHRVGVFDSWTQSLFAKALRPCDVLLNLVERLRTTSLKKKSPCSTESK